MILTSLPDLPPRPLTNANAAFRRMFYERWGRENAIVCGSGTDVAYATHPQTLSVKAAWGGSERYFLREREIAVDDDHWLILNEGSAYGSQIRATRPVASFSIFFRPGLQDEVAAAIEQSLGAALDACDPPARVARFSEHLRGQGGMVSQRLRAMREAVLAGQTSEDWLEQQLLLLLGSMLAHEARHSPRPPARSTRAELERRLRLAADFIDTCHAQPIALADMARIACLSPYHFVRSFRVQYGLAPYAYLLRKRARVARRLLAAGEVDREALAMRCGFGSRFALSRALARFSEQA